MYISDLIQRINHRLAGSVISQTELIGYMDSVIDDINARLDSKFPTYTEAIRHFLTPDPESFGFAPNTPGIPANSQGFSPSALNIEYTAIPDKYQRSVVIVGAAVKFYEVDEEGNQSALMFKQEYEQALFYMVRDFSFSIPEQYQEQNQGFVGIGDDDIETPGMRVPNNPFHNKIGFR